MTMTAHDQRPAAPAQSAKTPRIARCIAVPPMLDIVVPVYNEQVDLEASVRRLHDYLERGFPITWQITIADNASTDATWPIACGLSRDLRGVHAIRVAEKGRGRALHAAWGASDSDVLAYMDVDLSTDLAALLPLIAPLLSGHSDLAIGTRLHRTARVVRGPKRELISRCYNAILRTALRTGFSDAQCGFKAIRRDCATAILPQVQDQAWFFDTELLVLAERSGLRIHEVPVDWVDDPQSTVDIAATAIADLRGVVRLMRAPRLATQLSHFAIIGALSTLAYLGLYVTLRGSLGALGANAIALALTAVANTAANRRITFERIDRDGLLLQHVQAAGLFFLALALTSGTLGVLHAAATDPSRGVEVAALVAANVAATGVRFVLLRHWVFRRTRSAALN
jgi:putative flippase GtrA